MEIMIVAVPVSALFIGYVVAARKLAREYRIDDLPLVLRPVQIEQLEKLFDPREEADLRRDMSAAAFRQTQASRLRSAMEQVRRLSHNSAILGHWAAAEFVHRVAHKNRCELTSNDQAVERIIQAASRMRRQTIAIMMKIMLWRVLLLLHVVMMPIPSLSDLRETLGLDLLETYQSLTSAACELGLAYGRERYEELLAAL
jgi:hypothetical protein